MAERNITKLLYEFDSLRGAVASISLLSKVTKALRKAKVWEDQNWLLSSHFWQTRRPDIFALYGRQIMNYRSFSSLESLFTFCLIYFDDFWRFFAAYSLYEQIFISALEFDDIQLADICLEKLTSQFSNSNRVKRLIGMRYEATGMAIFSMNALFIVL